ncbi:hypothetical protein JAAARDRAFT_192430 [Jaapia argillacea MUCL 33604]|uniref:DUF6533 domain-containing protein n=1 Tax=Jaapia argillacea MUCL 33604 TaxID=933084 RepID=A0A067PVK0_9AGAM|nr:hypothetical protein JAAARDRAFT_192430 [Jaapia argillacea MUCL 33604]
MQGFEPAGFVQNLQLLRLFQFSGTILTIYDHSILLDYEVELIWKRPGIIAKIFFFLTRLGYCGDAIVIAILIPFLTEATSDGAISVFYCKYGLPSYPSGLYKFRVYALYNRAKWVLVLTLACFIIELATVIAFLASYQNIQVTLIQLAATCTLGCRLILNIREASYRHEQCLNTQEIEFQLRQLVDAVERGASASGDDPADGLTRGSHDVKGVEEDKGESRQTDFHCLAMAELRLGVQLKFKELLLYARGQQVGHCSPTRLSLTSKTSRRTSHLLASSSSNVRISPVLDMFKRPMHLNLISAALSFNRQRPKLKDIAEFERQPQPNAMAIFSFLLTHSSSHSPNPTFVSESPPERTLTSPTKSFPPAQRPWRRSKGSQD